MNACELHALKNIESSMLSSSKTKTSIHTHITRTWKPLFADQTFTRCRAETNYRADTPQDSIGGDTATSLQGYTVDTETSYTKGEFSSQWRWEKHPGPPRERKHLRNPSWPNLHYSKGLQTLNGHTHCHISPPGFIPVPELWHLWLNYSHGTGGKYIMRNILVARELEWHEQHCAVKHSSLSCLISVTSML